MKRTLLLLSTLLAAAPAFSQIAIEKHVLANGLTVILHEDHKLPLVTTYIRYKVGSRDENAGNSGFAHMFEHFMFEGSANVPAGHIESFSAACGAYDNASTSYDKTDYIFQLPPQCLEEALRIESDRMGYLEQGMTQASFNKVRDIVIQEKGQRGNQAYAQAQAPLMRNAYPEGHPYDKTPIGSEAALNAQTLENAKAFHARYYLPNNAIMVVSGDQNSAKTLALVNGYFGGLKAGPNPPAPVDIPGPPSTPRASFTDPKAEDPLLYMAWRIPGVGQPGHDEMSVLASLLTGGRSSRLVDALQVRDRKVLGIEAYMMGLQYGDLFVIGAQPAPGVGFAEVETAIEKEIAAMLKEGIQSERFAGLVKTLQTKRLDSLQSAAALVNALGEGEAVHGDPEDYKKEIERLRAMRPENVEKAAAQNLVTPNRTVLAVVPKQEAAQ